MFHWLCNSSSVFLSLVAFTFQSFQLIASIATFVRIFPGARWLIEKFVGVRVYFLLVSVEVYKFFVSVTINFNGQLFNWSFYKIYVGLILSCIFTGLCWHLCKFIRYYWRLMWLGRPFEDGSLIIRQFVVFSHDYIIIDELGHPWFVYKFI
jgi:hypothetical protein